VLKWEKEKPACQRAMLSKLCSLKQSLSGNARLNKAQRWAAEANRRTLGLCREGQHDDEGAAKRSEAF
jgi:hypothetical protein